MSLSDFLARAWTLANEKARSLGWIVKSRGPENRMSKSARVDPASRQRGLGGLR